MKKMLATLMAATFLTGCSQQEGVKVYDMEKAVETSADASLRSFTTSMDTIALETTDDCLLGGNAYVFYADDEHIFVRSEQTMFRFSADGKFKNRIGRRGNGPGEYNAIHAASMDAANGYLAYYVGQGRMQYWNYDGSLLKEVKLPHGKELTVVHLSGDDHLLAERRLYADDGLTVSILLLDREGNLLKEHPIGQDEQSVNTTMYSAPMMYEHGGALRYKDANAYTLHTYQDSLTVEARFDFGEYTPSREHLEDMNKREALHNEFAQLLDFQESSRHFFILLAHKREIKAAVMDKATGELVYCQKVKSPKRGGGIINDYLPGSSFWPSFIDADDSLYSLLWGDNEDNPMVVRIK